MPINLVGAKTRFTSYESGRSVIGKVVSAQNQIISVRFNSVYEEPLDEVISINTFANRAEFTAQAKVIRADHGKALMEVTTEVKEYPIGHDVRLLSRPIESICNFGDQFFPISVVAANDDALAFEAESSLPMFGDIRCVLHSGLRELELTASLLVQRFQSGMHRGVALVQNDCRITKTHLKRLHSA